jgi:hypothetical protein
MPLGAAAEGDDTVALRVTVCPNTGARFEEVTTVAVDAGTTVSDRGFEVDVPKSTLPE